ncbi:MULTISPECIES: SIR2 family NAD-dependent protein deacylase [Sphingomonas]
MRDIHVELVKRYGRAIAHMRQLSQRKRLGLALGAGVSQSAKLPSWNELITRITREIETRATTKGPDLGRETAPMQAQILQTRFRKFVESGTAFPATLVNHRDGMIATEWRKLLRDTLYEGITDPNTVVASHPYFEELAALAFNVPVVVTYNFDDFLERALATSPRRPHGTIGYYSAWGPHFVVQEDRPVVYHPNGYIPFQAIDRYSEEVILTEEALSNQIIDTVRGSFALLLNYFCKSSCLLLGFSLTDPGFRSLLRQAARSAPGTVHYYVRYCGADAPPISEQEEASQANFDLFNMVTLYLDGDEIKALLELLALEDEDTLNDVFVRAGVSQRYLYYVAGAVSVGKTSVISRLQGIEIVDEWLRPRDPLIAKPSDQLGPAERKRVDEWILEQVRLKNGRFARAGVGLHVMDRAPLDAFAFTPPDQYEQKAESIFETACAGKSGAPQSLLKGHLILLKGDPPTLQTRQVWRGRGGTEAYLEEQQNALVEVYADNAFGNVTFLETAGQDVENVTKQVLRTIHLDDYEEFDFNKRLTFFLSKP